MGWDMWEDLWAEVGEPGISGGGLERRVAGWAEVEKLGLEGTSDRQGWRGILGWVRIG